MLYLVYVLTFLAGILFYALSPRDDQPQQMTRQAEAFVSSFLLQHQAAKDYLYTWLGLDYAGQTNAYFNLHDFMGFDDDAYGDFSPHQLILESVNKQDGSQTNLTGAEKSAFMTRVFCLDGADNNLLGCKDANPKHTYLVTYGGNPRPAWWPKLSTNKSRRYESWRRALTNRTRGSISCGTLDCPSYTYSASTDKGTCPGNVWYINNGQSPTQTVPNAIVYALGYGTGTDVKNLQDLFFCMSDTKQGPVRYVPGLSAFYDGLANLGKGAPSNSTHTHGYGSGVHWTNAINPSNYVIATFSDSTATDKLPAAILATNASLSFNDIKLNPGTNFTLTILLRLNANGLTEISLFDKMKLYAYSEDVNNYLLTALPTDPTHITINGATCNGYSATAGITDSRVIAWTFVRTNDDNGTIRVYLNDSADPIVTVKDLADYGLANNQPLTLTNLADSTSYVYGIRYYKTALTTDNSVRNGHKVISDLKRNFIEDSKRFGIGSPKIPSQTKLICHKPEEE